MINTQTYKYLLLLCLLLFIQACSIPVISMKEPDLELPGHYSNNIDNNRDSVDVSINWSEFFQDSHLVELISIALENNQEINILAQRINRAKNEISARQGEYLPFINIGAGTEVEKAGEYTRNGAVEEGLNIREREAFPEFLHNYQFGLNASWEIDIWHKLRNSSKVAVMEYMASVEGRNFLITHLVAEIASLYYELEAYDNQLLNLGRNIKIQQQALAVVQELKQYGRETNLAVKRFQAEVKKNQSRQFQIQQDIVILENRLNLLLGRTPQKISRRSNDFMTLMPFTVNTGIPSELLNNRPDIRQAELKLRAARLNIDVAKANFYPSFEIKAGIGYEAFQAKFLLHTPESIALSLAGEIMAPLINRKAIIAEYKNASAEQIAAAYEYEKTILQSYIDVSNQLTRIENLRNSYALKQSQVTILDDAIEISQQLFKSAHADYLEVLLTQSESMEARAELIELKQKEVTAGITLYKALGGGWTMPTG